MLSYISYPVCANRRSDLVSAVDSQAFRVRSVDLTQFFAATLISAAYCHVPGLCAVHATKPASTLAIPSKKMLPPTSFVSESCEVSAACGQK